MRDSKLPEKVQACLDALESNAHRFSNLTRPNETKHGELFDENKHAAKKIASFVDDCEWATLLTRAVGLQADIKVPPKPTDEPLGYGALSAREETLDLSLSLSRLIQCATDSGLPRDGQLGTSWNEEGESLAKIEARIATMEIIAIETRKDVEEIKDRSGAVVQLGPLSVPLVELAARIDVAKKLIGRQYHVNVSLLALTLEQLTEYALDVVENWRRRTDQAAKALTNGFRQIVQSGRESASIALKVLKRLRKKSSSQSSHKESFSIPPDDKTRKQWEVEAAVSILLGETIPEARHPYLQVINLSWSSASQFEFLQGREANLVDAHYFVRQKDDWLRQVARMHDLSPLSALSQLKALYLDNTQVSDLSPLSALSELMQLHLEDTHVSNLSPLRALRRLQRLSNEERRVGKE